MVMIEAFLGLGNSLWEQNGWGLQVWGLLGILETNRISNARFTDEIKFYLPKNNAILFLSRILEQILTAKYAF